MDGVCAHMHLSPRHSLVWGVVMCNQVSQQRGLECMGNNVLKKSYV